MELSESQGPTPGRAADDLTELQHVGFRSMYLAGSRRMLVTATRPYEHLLYPNEVSPRAVVAEKVRDEEVVAMQYALDAMCRAINAGVDPQRLADMAAYAASFATEESENVLPNLKPAGMELVQRAVVTHSWLHESAGAVIVVTPSQSVEVLQGDIEHVGTFYDTYEYEEYWP